MGHCSRSGRRRARILVDHGSGHAARAQRNVDLLRLDCLVEPRHSLGWLRTSRQAGWVVYSDGCQLARLGFRILTIPSLDRLQAQPIWDMSGQ